MEAEMEHLTALEMEYKNWITDISSRFRQSQIKAAIKVYAKVFGAL